MDAPEIDNPLFFTDDVLTDAEGRSWRVVDTPSRVRIAGSNKPAYLLTAAANTDLSVPGEQRIWVRSADEIEGGRFTHPDGRGHPGGVAPEVLPIRGWAVSDWLCKQALLSNAGIAEDAGLHGLFLVVRKPDIDLDAAVAALAEVKTECPNLDLGISIPDRDGVAVLDAAASAGIQASWIHDCGVDEGLWDVNGKAIHKRYQQMDEHMLFAGVSFVAEDIDPDLAASVDAVQKAEMVPITSGTESDLDMIRKRASMGRLAFAGGLDPVSVEPMLAYITDAIASNGISHNFHELNPGKCRGFAESCRTRQIG